MGLCLLMLKFAHICCPPNVHETGFWMTAVISLVHFRVRYQKVRAIEDVTGRAKMFNGTLLILPRRLPNDSTVFHVEETTLTVTLNREKPWKEPQTIALANFLMKKVVLFSCAATWWDFGG